MAGCSRLGRRSPLVRAGRSASRCSRAAPTTTRVPTSGSPAAPEPPVVGVARAPTEPSLPVPEGVELTAEGSQLEVGDTATVAYEVRQGVVGVLDIRVTRLEKTSFKKSFVGLGPRPGPAEVEPLLRARHDHQPRRDRPRRPPAAALHRRRHQHPRRATTFASAFTPCEPGAFPKKFRTGKKIKVCLVFLSPKKGELTAVSFRPTQDFDPITWTGELEKPKPPKPDKPARATRAARAASGGAGRPRATAADRRRPPDPELLSARPSIGPEA